MPLYDQFPYTNFHELNLDWLVQKVASLEAAFPEGTIGISKGGTGADNSAQARENLGIIAPNIPLEDGGNYMMDTAIADLENSINALSDDLKYRIFRLVSDLGLTSGTATLSSCWAAMSIGDILIAPPSQFAPGQMPENAGSLIMVRNAGTSGSLRFYGNRTYEKQFSNNYPSGTWNQILNSTDIIPVNKGGTGADNAEAARQNLGIDFSGTVLSVCNVGADTAGNVPLKSNNLTNVFTTVTELGTSTGITIRAAWQLLNNGDMLVARSEEFTNAPSGKSGTIVIHKNLNGNGGSIHFYGDTRSDGSSIMYLTGSPLAPSGTWSNIGTAITSRTHLTDNQTIAAGGFTTVRVSIGNGQQTPIAIAGINISNASESGTGASWTAIGSYEFADSQVVVRVRNLAQTEINIKVTVRVLYI